MQDMDWLNTKLSWITRKGLEFVKSDLQRSQLSVMGDGRLEYFLIDQSYSRD